MSHDFFILQYAFNILPVIENIREEKILNYYPHYSLLGDTVSRVLRYAIFASQRTLHRRRFLVSNVHYDFRRTLVVPKREVSLAEVYFPHPFIPIGCNPLAEKVFGDVDRYNEKREKGRYMFDYSCFRRMLENH